ncbi:MAG TPA: MFS transporter [Longimicrobiales bacterium]|nr:MFS transporter [Longimicrobiales bacterium]
MAETRSHTNAGWLKRLGLERKELRAWALYDWGNSAFATTVMAAVLPIYYVKVAGADLPAATASAYWAYTSAIGLLLVCLASPVLGTIADYLGATKRFLAAFAILGAAATGALWFVGRGDWVLASILFTLGNFGFTGSIVYYDALLPHIAREDEIDRVSSAGWAVGYIGGGLLLLANAVMISKPRLFGLADAGVATRVSFVTVAIWWVLFTIPLLRHVPEPHRELEPDETPRESPVRAGFQRLGETLAEIRRYPDLLKFLVAFWLYSDGIGTIIRMATAYGTEIGIGQSALIGALILTQFVGIPFTFLFGALSSRIGPRNGIYIALAVYTLIAIAGYFVTTAAHFWALACAVGMVQGGAQALSRSIYATMIPKGKSSEFFSFFGVFEKFSGIAGPAVFGIVGQLTGTSRLGIVAVALFFVVGFAILSRVDIDAGRLAARAEESTLRPLAPADASTS